MGGGEFYTRLLWIILALGLVSLCGASKGNKNRVFKHCLQKCKQNQCQSATSFYQEQGLLEWLMWYDCEDECKYKCMWESEKVNAEEIKNWTTKQYYGKWPFIRTLGMEEPASSVFSALNGVSHYIMIRRYTRSVPRDAPLYWMWLGTALNGMNAWFWSTVFHARDVKMTELLDYFCATSLILWLFFTFFVRILVWRSDWWLFGIGVFILGVFVSHMYFMTNRFDYGYNMGFNVLFGAGGSILWLLWCFRVRNSNTYVKYAAFVILGTNLFLLLELYDFPPVLWIFDAHAVWHCGTIFMPYFWYRFGIKDSLVLHEQKYMRTHRLPVLFVPTLKSKGV